MMLLRTHRQVNCFLDRDPVKQQRVFCGRLALAVVFSHRYGFASQPYGVVVSRLVSDLSFPSTNVNVSGGSRPGSGSCLQYMRLSAS
jgi:hypothetical protein